MDPPPPGRAALTWGGALTPTLAARLAEMRRDRALAPLLDGGGGAQPPAAGPGGNFSWGSALAPWDIARVGWGVFLYFPGGES